jgi:hypothetical protein
MELKQLDSYTIEVGGNLLEQSGICEFCVPTGLNSFNTINFTGQGRLAT